MIKSSTNAIKYHFKIYFVVKQNPLGLLIHENHQFSVEFSSVSCLASLQKIYIFTSTQ